jgi:hypothetical protein
MNRWLNQFRLQFEKRVIDVYGKATFSSGAPTLSASNSKGLVSCTHDGTGLYTFVFGTNSTLPLDTYVKLLCVDAVFFNASSAPAAPIHSVRTNNISVSGTASIQIAFYNLSGSLTDPADGDTLFIDFCLGDSTAP